MKRVCSGERKGRKRLGTDHGGERSGSNLCSVGMPQRTRPPMRSRLRLREKLLIINSSVYI